MLSIKKAMATVAAAAMLGGGVGVAVGGDSSATTTAVTPSTQVAPPSGGPPGSRPPGGGPGDDVSTESVSTEQDLVALVGQAYGEENLDLHRGHQDVQDVLTEVLGVSHDELHVRMEQQGQNLAAVAEDVGVDPQELVDALVAADSPAIDALLDAGTISQAQADGYLEQLEAAFTFRVNWDGSEATPTATTVS